MNGLLLKAGIALCGVVASGICAWVCYEAYILPHSGEEAYFWAKGAGRDSWRGPSPRVRGARYLARPDVDPVWVVLYLRRDALVSLSEDQGALAPTTAPGPQYEIGHTVVLLRELPEDVPPAVLLAVVDLLDIAEEGFWSERTFTSDRVYASPPLREVARKFLRSRLGEDHAFDKEKWRRTIARGRRGQTWRKRQ
jgi:hypothetical protein